MMDDELCTEPHEDGGICGQRKETHEHLNFDLERDKDALVRIREFLGEAVAGKSDDELLAELRSGDKMHFTTIRWKALPRNAFRNTR